MATALSPAAPAPTLPAMDFSDWLSPILVKELRQGLKTKAFVSIFILVQVVMTLLVGMQLLTLANSGGTRMAMQAFDGFFWAFVWIPLLVLMPARGLMAISEEIKANTLDLVQLTRMSAFRIVFGKWVALVAQSVLLVAAILPYAVLRYFFGQINVVDDLIGIAVLLAASLVMTAGAVALSSAPFVFRIIVLVVGLPLFFIVGASTFFASRFMPSGTFTGTTSTWMIIALVGCYVYLLLEIAATRIAPLSENHAARKRVVALGMACFGTVLAWCAPPETSAQWLAGCSLMLGWIVLEALCEHTVKVPSLYTSFSRRGIMGRLAGRVLYPGWATGLVFTTLLVGLMKVNVFYLSSQMGSPLAGFDSFELTVMAVLDYGALIAPLPILLLFPRVRQPIWLYVLIQALFGLLFCIATIIGNTPGISKEMAYRWLAPFPTSALFAYMEGGTSNAPLAFYATITLPVVVVLMVYLAFRVMREFRVISKLEKDSLPQDATAS